MNDIEGMSGKFDAPDRNGEMAVLTGIVPVASMSDYAKDVTAYTKGHGSLTCTLHGYLPCHNTEEVVETTGYDSEHDLANPTVLYFVRMEQDLWFCGIRSWTLCIWKAF